VRPRWEWRIPGEGALEAQRALLRMTGVLAQLPI
jgi:hypothetical protein